MFWWLKINLCRERVHVPKSKPFISLIGKPNITMNANIAAIGNGIGLPIITNSTKASDKDSNGQQIGTINTATLWVQSDFFCATAVTIQVIN